MGANAKFPDPKKFGEEDAIIFCDRKRALKLYNQEHENKLEDDKNQNIAKELKHWFMGASLSNGWVAHPVRHPTRKYAGFLMFNVKHLRKTGDSELTLPYNPYQKMEIQESDNEES